MPRKSVYFPDGLLPRIECAAESEQRSLSQWVSMAAEAALAITGADGREVPVRPGPVSSWRDGDTDVTVTPPEAQVVRARATAPKPRFDKAAVDVERQRRLNDAKERNRQ